MKKLIEERLKATTGLHTAHHVHGRQAGRRSNDDVRER